jgi:hypothetical protein
LQILLRDLMDEDCFAGLLKECERRFIGRVGSRSQLLDVAKISLNFLVEPVPNFFLRRCGLVLFGESAAGAGVRVRDLLDALRPKIEDAVAEPLDAFPDLLAVDTVAEIVDAVRAMFFDTADETVVVLETLFGFPDDRAVTLFAVEPDAKVDGDFLLAGHRFLCL